MIKIAQNFVKSLDLNVKIEEWNGSLGNYNYKTDTISLNIKKIRKIFSHHRKQVPYVNSVSDYITLITCHELGHRDDYKIEPYVDLFVHYTEGKESLFLNNDFCNEIREKIVNGLIEREMNAWRLGSKYVREERLDDYNLMNQEYINENSEKYYNDTSEFINAKVEFQQSKIEIEELTAHHNET